MIVFGYGFLFGMSWILVMFPAEIVKYIKVAFGKSKKNCRYRYETDNSLHPK